MKQFKILFLIFVTFFIRNSSEICKNTHLYINDTVKFPDSYFSAFRTFSGNPHNARIEYPINSYSWHTSYIGSGWLQVYLGLFKVLFFYSKFNCISLSGEIYDIYGMDIQGSCYCQANEYYYTSKFNVLYGLDSNNLNTISQDGSDIVSI